jgi:hypothetical protein
MSILVSFLLAPAVAGAQDSVGASITHGPDPASISQGPETPPAFPLGGALGKREPDRWCGAELNADDTVHEVDNGPYRFHGVFMLAADVPDRFSNFSDRLQADAFRASSLLEARYNRAIRFDLGTSCGPQYLDITVIRMAQTSAQMAAVARKPNGTFDAVAHALDAARLPTTQPTDTIHAAAARTRNYLVWLDAPAQAGSCGQANGYADRSRDQSNLNNFGGKTAVVFRHGDDAFCSSNAARHEIGHTLGALQPDAPHAFDGSHCNDAYEDTMCYSNSPSVADRKRGTFFDYNNDDYWSLPGAPLDWWTVDLNRFVCPDATCNQGGSSPVSAPGGSGLHGSMKVRAQQKRHGIWKLILSATGEGDGVVIVRCHRKGEDQWRTVFRRALSLPRSLRTRVHCGASRPRAKLLMSD